MTKLSEFEIRIAHGGAVKKNGQWYCSVHTDELLFADGECDECNYVESTIGMDQAEARAMNQSQEILENDDFFEVPPVDVPLVLFDVGDLQK